MTPEYAPELPRLKENLRRVIAAYCAFTKLKESSALVNVLGAATPRLILIDPDADLRAGKYDQWMKRFSRAWPAGLEWPASVPRPPVEAEAAVE